MVLGLRYIVDPAATGLEFGVAGLEPKGLATLRADMFALFWTGGLTMIAGAFFKNRVLLLVPAGLCALALVGRFASLAVEGPSAGMITAMAVVGVSVVLLLRASQILPASRQAASA